MSTDIENKTSISDPNFRKVLKNNNDMLFLL